MPLPLSSVLPRLHVKRRSRPFPKPSSGYSHARRLRQPANQLRSAYQNPLSFTILPTVTITAGAHGAVGTGTVCPNLQLGLVSNAWLDGYLRAAIPGLAGVSP